MSPVPSVPPHPGSSSAAVSARMSRARRRDTAPEVAARRALYRAGLRYRVVYPIPGQRRRTIDIAFVGAKIAVFIDGCFWHGCPQHGTQPRSNSGWWQTKIATNQARDRDSDQLLAEAGWTVLRFWEHVDPGQIATEVEAAVSIARRRPAGSPKSPEPATLVKNGEPGCAQA